MRERAHSIDLKTNYRAHPFENLFKRDFYYKVFGSRDNGPVIPLLALLSEPIRNRNAYFEKYYSDDVSDDETFEFTSSQSDQCEKESYCFQLVETITLIVINHRNWLEISNKKLTFSLEY